MPPFTTESAVRLAAQVEDTSLAATALIEASVAEAHEVTLAAIDPAVDHESPPTAVVQGETALAAAILFRALAARDAVEQVPIQIGGQRIEAGQRFASLMSVARRFEKEGDRLLAPYSLRPAALPPGDVTETRPVIGL